MYRYFYDPQTGEFLSSTNSDAVVSDLPYIQRDTPFFYSDYRVDVETGELIYTPAPRNPRG